MSYSQIIYASTDGQMKHGKEFRNSWLWGPFVWDTLADRYGLGTGMSRWSPLFDRIQNKEIVLTSAELNVLRFTFDASYVEGDRDIQRLVDSLRLFGGEGPNQLLAMADEIQRLLISEPGLQYLGLYGTSVSENCWMLSKEEDEEDGDEAEYRLHNFAGNPEKFVAVCEPRHWPMVAVS